jgi:hypothetical protein
MANKKISQLTAKGARLAATDLVEIAEDAGGGNYVTKSVTGANITGGQIIAAVSNTIGTTITGLTNAISDSFLLPANTFSSNCQIELQWYPSRIAGTGTASQGLVYINSTNSLTGATLVATGTNLTNTGVTNLTCRRTVAVRSNVGTLMSTTNQASSDFSTTQPTENLPFDNTSGIYFLFVMNNVGGATLQSRNVGYRLVGYNL